VATAIETLEQRLGKKWPAIAAARATTAGLVSQLTQAVGDLGDPNIAVVTTGSLGRGEATKDSESRRRKRQLIAPAEFGKEDEILVEGRRG
jgi:hypothetical protein